MNVNTPPAVNRQDPNGNTISNVAGTNDQIDTLGRVQPYGAATTDFSNCPSGTSSAYITNYPSVSGGVAAVKMCF